MIKFDSTGGLMPPQRRERSVGMTGCAIFICDGVKIIYKILVTIENKKMTFILFW
jgi:hypothetical protein